MLSRAPGQFNKTTRKISYSVDLEDFHSRVSRGPMGRLKQGAGRGRVQDLGHTPFLGSMGGMP